MQAGASEKYREKRVFSTAAHRRVGQTHELLKMAKDPSLITPLTLRDAQDDIAWRLALCLVTKMLLLSANAAVILNVILNEAKEPRSESGGVSEGSMPN